MSENPAIARLFKNVFVCKICGHKIKADPLKVSKGLIKCRNCKRKVLKPKRMKKK